VSLLVGHGDGTFAAPLVYPTGGEPVSLALGDLDGDGATDMAVVGKTTRDLVVHLNRLLD